ncbi:MAG: hypothetical protein ABIC82_04360, partial [bacterium]
FRVGCWDAERLEKEFLPWFDREHLMEQKNYEIIYKKLLKGETEDPSFTRTFPDSDFLGDEASRGVIIKTSRQKYGRDVLMVEGKIGKWFEGNS